MLRSRLDAPITATDCGLKRGLRLRTVIDYSITAKVQRRFNIEQAPWTMKIKERRFPYSTACTLTLVNSPQGGKTYDDQGHTP